MNSLKDTILKYSKILYEDITLQQLGNIIISASDKNFTDDEIISKLKTLTNNNSWFNITKNGKLAYISIIPFNWNKSKGDIIDCASEGHNEKERSKIEYIINYWINKYPKNLKKDYEHVYYIDRRTGEDKKLF